MKPQVGINDSHEEMNPEMSPEIGRRKKYNYANDLVKIQVCASFHMPALNNVLNKDLYGEVTDESVMASNKRNTTRREGVEYQLL